MAAIEPLEDRRLLTGNLVPAFTGRLPATIAPSGATHLNVKVVDSGATAVAETMTLRIYASTDGSLDGSDVLLDTVEKNVRLKPRAGASVPVNLPTPTNLPNGNYFLLAQLDDSSPVAAAKKQMAFQNPFSDFAVQFARLPSQPVEIDGPSAGKCMVFAKIVNAGNIVARGTATVNIYLSADATLDASDGLLATVSSQPIALKPHAAQMVSFRVAVPPGTAVGAYFLFATLTSTGSSTDSNTANNTAISSRRVAVVTHLPQPTRIEHNHYYYDNGTYIYEAIGAYAVDAGAYTATYSGADNYSTGNSDYSSSDGSSYVDSGNSQSNSAPDTGSSDSASSSDRSPPSDGSVDMYASGGDF